MTPDYFPLAEGAVREHSSENAQDKGAFKVEVLSVETPAGKFGGCMRVAYLIAKGDGGSGERWDAPSVGLVKVAENDEAEPPTHALIAYSG